jgi:hypothetical protein
MPKSFTRCVASGGRVRTKKLPESRYIHVCFKGGKAYAGEAKAKKGGRKR